MHRPSKLFSVSAFHSISLVPPVFPSFISLDASFFLVLPPDFLILLSACLSVPSTPPSVPPLCLTLSVAQPFPPSSPFRPTSLLHYLFISPSLHRTPDLKIILANPLPQEGRGKDSLEPERVSLLPVCDLKPCLMLKPIHPLSTTFYSLWKTLSVDIQLNIHLTIPPRSV